MAGVGNYFEVRRSKGTGLQTDADLYIKSSESLSGIVTCFLLEADNGGSSAAVGRVLIVRAMRCGSAVRDAAGSEGYLGDTRLPYSQDAPFASTASSVALCAIDGDKTEAAASERLQDRQAIEARSQGSRCTNVSIWHMYRTVAPLSIPCFELQAYNGANCRTTRSHMDPLGSMLSASR